MRRQDREITSPDAVRSIVQRARVFHLAMVDEGRPYVLPLSYGYDGTSIYLHCASEGRKLDILRRFPQVCFTISVDEELIRGDRPCDWSFRYRNVVGEGTVHFVEGEDEKRRGLDAVMRQYGGEGGDYPSEVLARTTILRIDIASLSGKQAGYE